MKHIWILEYSHGLPPGGIGVDYVKGVPLGLFVELTGSKEEAKKFPSKKEAVEFAKAIGRANTYNPIRIDKEN